MSLEPNSPSEGLERLARDGYEVAIRSGHLILGRVPYVTRERTVKYGRLVCPLASGDLDAGQGLDHTVYFAGDYPCDDKGEPIEALRNSSERQELAKHLWVDHHFSAKPEGGSYRDIHHKMTHYAQSLERYARRIDPGAIAQAGRLEVAADASDPFMFMETASSRAGITSLNERLAGDKIGIVGLGGTGSYILDYVSKTRVSEIHLFDGDHYQQHNAFRAPGATQPEELEQRTTKAKFYSDRYSAMRNGVIAHEFDITEVNVGILTGLDFVFIAIDNNEARHWLLQHLARANVPFVDVGIGIEKKDNQLLGIVRTSFSESPRSAADVCDECNPSDGSEYERNIQIVELNALNAALAVIRWKKHREFYLDLGHENRSTYTIDGNHMSNRTLGKDENRS